MMNADETRRGTLWGVGLGPGDPELVTVKAARVIARSRRRRLSQRPARPQHRARHRRTVSAAGARSRSTWSTRSPPRPPTIPADTPVRWRTSTARPPTASPPIWTRAADVALLAEGDPLFYSSYMHMHTRLTERFDAVIVPGVTSVSAASAATATPLVQGDEVLTIIPGTLPVDELKRRLADTDAAVILKLGRSYPAVREALSSAGRLDDAYYVERASTPQQRVLPAAEVDDDKVPYFSLAMLPGAAVPGRRPRAASRSSASGPGDIDWMTPQSRRELAAATDLIGYGPYLDRIRPRDGQRRHPSDNTDEPARARLACTLAEEGRAVAVVSSGDPGVFAMATAVLEEAKQWPGVTVRVIPAMTAAQAVASRVGRAAGPRLRGDLAVRSAQAVGRHRPHGSPPQPKPTWCWRSTTPRRRRRTWQVGAMRDLLLEHRDPGHPGGDRPRRVRSARRGEGGAAGRPRPRRGRYAVPADRRVVADPVVRRSGVHAAPLPDALILSRSHDHSTWT